MFRCASLLIAFALLVTLAGASSRETVPRPAYVARPSARVDVLFSPHGGCQARIIREIRQARTSVKVQAYSFTNAKIAKAILDAQTRGIDCEVILDKSQRTARYSSAAFFHNQAVPLLIDGKHAIAHNKIIIIDDATVITGSYNFSKAAEESNAENLLVISGMPELAQKYVENYARHRKHSTKYTRPDQ